MCCFFYRLCTLRLEINIIENNPRERVSERERERARYYSIKVCSVIVFVFFAPRSIVIIRNYCLICDRVCVCAWVKKKLHMIGFSSQYFTVRNYIFIIFDNVFFSAHSRRLCVSVSNFLTVRFQWNIRFAYLSGELALNFSSHNRIGWNGYVLRSEIE